jgi:hypothetical protein
VTGSAKPNAGDSPAAAAPHWAQKLSIYLSLAALIISVPAALLNVGLALRGPEISILHPEPVMIYRDPGRETLAALAIAVPITMVNTATGHSDVLLAAELELGPDGPTIGYHGAIEATVADDPAKAANGCAPNVRCIPLARLLVQERSDGDEVISLPGGEPRTRFFAFRLVRPRCRGNARDCDALANFDTALAHLRRFETVRVRLRFLSDGEHSVACSLAPLLPDYIRENQWQTFACTPDISASGAAPAGSRPS